MSLILFLLGGAAANLAAGFFFQLIGGRPLAFSACRVLAAIASGLPLVIVVCAFVYRDLDDDGRATGMLVVGGTGMLLASLSSWLPVWYFRTKPEEQPEANPGLNREGPRGPNA